MISWNEQKVIVLQKCDKLFANCTDASRNIFHIGICELAHNCNQVHVQVSLTLISCALCGIFR